MERNRLYPFFTLRVIDCLYCGKTPADLFGKDGHSEMGLFRRSFFNLVRSPGMTLAVVAILAVSLGLVLTMFEVHGATAGQLGTISGQIGNQITVRPAGSSGFDTGSGTLA